MNNIQFSIQAANLISNFEGFESKPYVDPATHAEPITIAYGSTHYCDGTKVTMKDAPVTKEQGLQMLVCHLNNVILPDFQKHITVSLTQYEIDALASLVYNIGDSGFDNSHVLIDINQNILSGDLKTRWLAWDRANQEVNQGLLNRRIKEYTYFETGKLI